MAGLSQDDVAKLMAERSADVRIETANKLASQFSQGALTGTERQLAEEIFRLMAKDAEIRVRQSLAINLKETPALPHDVALSLAKDVDTVALPILQFSKVLTDTDLIEIVRSQSPVKQVAIARREAVSSQVSEALVDTQNVEVVESLVANEGAEISETALQRIVDEYGSDMAVQDSLVSRTKLPMTVAERLLSVVSDHMREVLIKRHQLPDEVVAGIINQSRERATITLSAGADREDVEGLVRHLNGHRRLTSSLMLRAVCMGDIAFFAAGMAELAGIPLLNAQRLIEDTGKLGFKALYEKSHLPMGLYPAFRCAIDVAREMEFDGGEQDRERYSRRMLERILTQYEMLGVTFNSSDMEYLLTKMSQLPSNIRDAD